MLEYLSLDIIYSSKLAFAIELQDLTRKTVCGHISELKVHQIFSLARDWYKSVT